MPNHHPPARLGDAPHDRFIVRSRPGPGNATATETGTETGTEIHRLTFHGAAGSLFGIYVVNVFLTLLTAGVYLFWAKVRTRRFVIGQTALDGDRFSYHGLGREVLLGSLKAALVFGVPLAALNSLPRILDAGWTVTILTSLAGYGLVMVLVPVARVGARRYRLGRTAWRGIRFAFRGRVRDFVGLFVANSLLTVATLGLYYPVSLVRNHGFMVRHSHFGNGRFDFDGDGRDLIVDFLYAVLLTLPTLGLGWFWFAARTRRYLWDHTSFQGARFRCTVTGGRLLALKAGNLAVIVLTLGLGWSLATVRNARFACDHLRLKGAVDLATIDQALTPATATGEGLLSFLESDFDLG